MGEPVPLLTSVNNVSELCGKMSETLWELASRIRSSRPGLASMAAEGSTAQSTLVALREFLEDDSMAVRAKPNDRNGFYSCCETLTEAISHTIVDFEIEVKRLRRYSQDGNPADISRAVPILQDSLIEAKHNLRQGRASLALMLDCMKSGILRQAHIAFADQGSEQSLRLEKFDHTLSLQPLAELSLAQQTTKPNIEALLTKIRPKAGKAFKVESRLVKKLHEGITKGDHAAVFKCLADRANPNAPYKGSSASPLHSALTQAEAALGSEDEEASRDLLAIITSLVLAGADLKAIDDQGRTPLIRVVKGEMGDSLAALMAELGSPINAVDRERNTALHYAAMQDGSRIAGNHDIVRILIAHGADHGLKNMRGRTPLYKAVMWERVGRVKELLDYGADMESVDKNGWSALFSAVLQNSVELTMELCSRGAHVDRRDASGQTALHYSVSQNRREVVETLLNAGADVNLLSKGETVLCRAVSKGNLELVQYLIKKGANVTTPSPGYGGALPVHFAAIGKNAAILRALLDAGSPVDVADEMGRTPIDWAKETGRGEVVEILWKMGAKADT